MMNHKITYGKVCRKVETTPTQTPVPVLNGPDILEPTVTLNFYINSICSEEILDLESAKNLYNSLSKIFN